MFNVQCSMSEFICKFTGKMYNVNVAVIANDGYIYEKEFIVYS